MQDEEKHLKRVNEIEEEEQHLKDRLSAQKSEIMKTQSEADELRKTLLTLNRYIIVLLGKMIHVIMFRRVLVMRCVNFSCSVVL